jgi:uncharacterized protein YbaR (Trm112 family)
VDNRLLDVLVCPLCKGPLQHDKAAKELICNGDRLAYPIRDGIPTMWADDARDMNADVNSAVNAAADATVDAGKPSA